MAVVRGVAQFGSALDWGSRGRWFKSSRPDCCKSTVYKVAMQLLFCVDKIRFDPSCAGFLKRIKVK